MPRSPLVRLQWPQSSWRFSTWSVPPLARAMMWSTSASRCRGWKCSAQPVQKPPCWPYSAAAYVRGLGGSGPRSVRRGVSVLATTWPKTSHQSHRVPGRQAVGARWHPAALGLVAGVTLPDASAHSRQSAKPDGRTSTAGAPQPQSPSPLTRGPPPGSSLSPLPRAPGRRPCPVPPPLPRGPTARSRNLGLRCSVPPGRPEPSR